MDGQRPMILPPDYPRQIAEHGYAVVPEVLDGNWLDRLTTAIERLSQTTESRSAIRRRGDVYAIRNLTDAIPEIRDLALDPHVLALVQPIVGDGAALVRATLFDKSPTSNWGVMWHQDLTIAVKQRCDLPGFDGWSVKAGVACVQAPAGVLEKMLAVRLHFDACGLDNGPLQVLPGSHRFDRLSIPAIERMLNEVAPQSCVCPRGGAVVMRPLLLHASAKAKSIARRRVIHLEFVGEHLPPPLERELSGR